MTGDLHCHSYYSDGYFSPAEVVKKAKAAGCEVMSLTDHDALGGTSEAENAARTLGVKFIRGVEISAYDGMDVHILGYGIDTHSPRFKDFLRKQQTYRRERARIMIEKLSHYGITFPDGTFDFCVEREISRSHIADAIFRCGYEPDFTTAFNKWCRYDSPTYVNTYGTLPRAAIEEIHAAGGLSVLAHPMRLALKGDELTDYIKKIASFGVDGIEAVYRSTPTDETENYVRLAKSLGIFYTAGNDFHGFNNQIIPRELTCEKLLNLAK